MKKTDKTILILLSLIFLLGIFLRTFKLSAVPYSLNIDEISIGYNAYSILKTGKDEHGVFLPLAFQSIGDFKAPLLIYTIIPAIYFFGLNEFGLRITVAFLGSLAILATFFLTLELTKNKYIAALASFSLAISPWHINFSRGAYESILASLLIILGVYTFLLAIRINYRWLILSGVLFSLSLYAYHAQRVFTPLLVLFLVILFRKELWKNKKQTVVALIVAIISFLPLFLALLSPQNNVRAQASFITRDVEINSQLHSEGEKRDLTSYALDNNFLITFNFWAKRYLEYFDLDFFFLNGMRYALPKTPDIGIMYLAEMPFWLVGLYLVVFKKDFISKRNQVLVLGWLLLGIIPASLANNSHHLIRSLTLIPILQILVAVGLFYLLQKLNSLKKQTVFLICYLGLIFISLVYFGILYGYIAQYRAEGAGDGWKQAALFALENSSKYKEVIIDPRFGTTGPNIIGTPHTYLLFYGQVDPREFLTDPRRKEFGGSSNFRNFTFREIDWNLLDKSKKDTLFIGSSWVLPAEEQDILEKFYLLNGKEILRAASPK